MKVRSSFVTNSSSSSFILALKKDTNENELRKDVEEIYKKNKKNIVNSFKEDLEYYNSDFEGNSRLVEYFKEKDEENFDKEMVKYLTENFLNIFQNSWSGKKYLDSWQVESEEFSNEDEFFGALMYNEINRFDGDVLKIM